MRILLVEDDPLIGKAVARGLEDASHSCTWSKNGRSGLEEALSQRHDAIVLDLMLPEIAGLDVLRQMRAKGVKTPVVVLTALGSVDDRVAGLREGADDYLVKPFAFPELLARLEAVRRRSAEVKKGQQSGHEDNQHTGIPEGELKAERACQSNE